MKLGNIKGESAAEQYKDWIVLTGVKFDATQVLSTGGGGAGSTGKPLLNEFIVKKSYDSSSIPIFQDLLTGKHSTDCKIVFVSRGESPTPILTIELLDVLISDYNFDNMFETIGLNFTRIKSTYSGGTSPITGDFDFKTNK
jgi:type VI secretion system secreted protein Hcp